MQARIFTVPNQLTILRLGFLPLFLIAALYEHYRTALAVLLIAALTDTLDGFIARRLNQKTALGAYLDPIADKLLLSSSFIVLSLKGKMAWWLTIMVISRDVML
ncbi:MAG TPA: CDP-alcohol phosphatidyltransferase family protein, partial [Candidatus Acidoferrales bacterium]|nr:CDP-alcohol phosphatidyltransferase family protein [Candidatus Acidoferrales bacterium]